MIDEISYIKISEKLQELQATNRPCILLFVDSGFDDNMEINNTLSWVSAVNSFYESFGMVSRAKTCMDAIPMYEA